MSEYEEKDKMEIKGFHITRKPFKDVVGTINSIKITSQETLG